MRFRFLLILGLMTIGALTNSALAGVSANFSTSKSFTDPSNSCSEVITITNKTTGQVSGVNYVYAWNWGDGNSEFSYAKATTPTHTYNYPGTFTITLDISDMSNQGVTLSSLTGTVTTKGAAPTVASNPVVYGPTYSGVNGLVTLNGGNSTTTSGTLTYLWTLDNPVIINGHSVSSFNTATVNLVIPTTISDQTFTATLTVTDPANTCATNSVAATAFTINHTAVAPTPIVAAFVPTANGTPNSGTCDYAVSITNTTNTVSGAHYNYLWYYGDGSSVTTTDASPAPAAYTYIYPGTYTIQLNVYDANGQYLSTVSHPVTTKGTGPSVVSVPVVYGPTYSGHYGLVTLNGGNSTTTSGTLTYLWTLDNPVIINGHSVSSFNTSNVNLSIPTSGSDQTFTATLTVTDPANTCATNSVAATAFTINHTAVAPTPIVAAFAPTANGTPNTGTCDYAVSISNTTNTVSGAHYSYVWYYGDGSSVTTTDASPSPAAYTYTYPGTYTILLNVYDANGQYLSTVSHPVTTKGTGPSVVSVPVVYGPTYSGVNGLVTLNGGNSTTTSGTLSYVWTLDNPVIINGHSVSSFNTSTVNLVIPTTISDQTFTATLTVTDPANTCATNSVAATTFVINKTVLPIVATIGTTKSGSCTEVVHFANNTTNLISGTTYNFNWSFGDGTTYSTTSTATYDYTYVNPGTYNVFLQVTDVNNQYVSSGSKSVTTIGTAPTVTAVTSTSGPYSNATTSTATVNGGNSTISYGTIHYSWAITIDDGQTPSHQTSSTSSSSSVPFNIARTGYDQTVTAVLTVSNASGCVTDHSTESFVVPALSSFVKTGINGGLNHNTISIYPNPASSNINLNIGLEKVTENVVVKVYNSLGQQVAIHNLAAGKMNKVETNISISHLTEGMYFVRAFNAEGELIGNSTILKH